jgi:hypothetical protein
MSSVRPAARWRRSEPLMRRGLAIFFAFQCDIGHAHAHRDAALNNYVALLTAIAMREGEIVAALTALVREVGLDPE